MSRVLHLFLTQVLEPLSTRPLIDICSTPEWYAKSSTLKPVPLIFNSYSGFQMTNRNEHFFPSIFSQINPCKQTKYWLVLSLLSRLYRIAFHVLKTYHLPKINWDHLPPPRDTSLSSSMTSWEMQSLPLPLLTKFIRYWYSYIHN